MSDTSPGIGDTFMAVVRRDLTLAYRHRGELLNPLLFYVLVITLFPLAVGADPERLGEIAGSVIWVAALLSTMLALDGMFRPDHEDGTLEQMMLCSQPAALLVCARILVHWMTTGLPLIIMTPILALLMNMGTEVMVVLLGSLALGTPTLSLIGSVGAALTVGIRRGNLLFALLVLPLYVPVLIFGAGVVSGASQGLPVSGQFFLLGAMLALSATLAPIACAASLRVSID